MLPIGINFPHSYDFDDEVEIVYWRKNWGLRNAVLGALENAKDGGDTTIDTLDQIFTIMKVIISFMDKKTWDEDGGSIWEYEDIKPVLQRDILNLSIIAAFMTQNPDVYLVFYDSY